MTPARQFYIRESDLTKFGFTDGCPKCQYALRYGHSNAASRSHSQACRERIKAKLLESPEGQMRIGKMVERMERYFAKEVEQGDQPDAQGPQGEKDDSELREHRVDTPPISVSKLCLLHVLF